MDRGFLLGTLAKNYPLIIKIPGGILIREGGGRLLVARRDYCRPDPLTTETRALFLQVLLGAASVAAGGAPCGVVALTPLPAKTKARRRQQLLAL